jgi:hypothetical protein
MKIAPSDADKWKPGDETCLVLSPCDPPTMDMFRVFDAAFDQGKFSTVWLCPLYVNDEQAKRATQCCSVLCSEYYSANHRVVGLNSVALNKKIGDPKALREWIVKHWPFVKPKTCMLANERGAHDVDVVATFSGQESLQYKSKWTVRKYAQSPSDMAARLASGSNESRWFPQALWEFLLKKGLYRSR